MLEVALMVLQAAVGGQDSPQLAAVRAMEKAVREGDWKRFHREFGHPVFQKDVSAEELEKAAQEPEIKGLAALMAAIVKAADEKAGKDILLLWPAEPEGTYAFILVKVRDQPAAERKGALHSLELKRDAGAWKFLSAS